MLENFRFCFNCGPSNEGRDRIVMCHFIFRRALSEGRDRIVMCHPICRGALSEGRDKTVMCHPICRGALNWSAVCCSLQSTSLWETPHNCPSYLGWHNYHFSFMSVLMNYKMFKGAHQKNLKKTFIHTFT